MAPTISVSEPQYTWQWQSSRGHILAGALDELHQVCFRDTKKLYSSITVVSSSWSHLQVRALQHGWSIIIWATAGPAGRAEPRPWELWEKKLCLARSYTGGRCHTPYEDFGIGFPGSKKKKWLFPNGRQRDWDPQWLTQWNSMGMASLGVGPGPYFRV